MFNRLGKGLIASLIMLVGLCAPQFAYAQQGSLSDTYSSDDLVERGGAFFGSVSQGLASLVEKVVGQYGLPNGYILGEEAGGALFAGAKYGQGTLYTRNLGEYPVYWQGPSVGLDFGGDGSKVMMLVYSLPDINSIYARYPGVNGSAYVVGGFGMTVMKRQNVVLVPIRSGVGARLGLNVGYLKFTQEPTWNPF
ncbi:DUF1134 domain-containing protein [Paradevosia shaoguanensis]|jgi:hypothetical protein|uniref:DUF1134 domain-containing protein n=1 Tax=Paradevosia shaoguanensis TaxID=1335043 RepID=UPI000455C4B3|nr:hypothetical protein JP74_00660 [Devosia sp. 17-2-E-8]MBI4045657.1 DUF1134 domain-containing protein [Devosia nanyangense]QMV00820.1 DUF1134 domain-containing protein [Devosia sp. D6-9]CDP53063.1 FIG00450386: hypothetical protein [Devosia sp. DBB001]